MLPILLAQNLGVKRVALGAGQDPDSLRLEQGPEALRAAIEGAEDSVILEFERLAPPGVARQPRQQATAASAITELLAPIKDGVLRYGYSRQAADRLGVPVELLWKRLVGKDQEVAVPATTRRRSDVVQSEEEHVLHLLLVADPVPELPELPDPAFFFDREYRAIYEAWHQRVAAGKPPSPRELIEAAGEHAATVARLVQSELQSPAAPGGGELAAPLAKLRRRWQRQRARELTAEIAEADRQGETDKVNALLQEKATLSRALHPRH